MLTAAPFAWLNQREPFSRKDYHPPQSRTRRSPSLGSGRAGIFHIIQDRAGPGQRLEVSVVAGECKSFRTVVDFKCHLAGLQPMGRVRFEAEML
jgi:hypothetical protein